MDICGVNVFIDGENGAIPHIHPIKYSDLWIFVLLVLFYFQNNAWNTHQWSVFKLLLGTWWVGNQLCYRFQFTGPGGIIQLVNCNQHYYKYYGYRKFILWNCFSYYLFLLCFGHYDCNRNLARQKKKDNENSRKQWIQPEPSSSSNSLKKWTKHVNDYYNILTQCN